MDRERRAPRAGWIGCGRGRFLSTGGVGGAAGHTRARGGDITERHI